jgi:hypothetical protein
VVLCAETEEEEEDGKRRAEEEKPQEAKVTNQPQLGSAPTSYPSLLSIYLSLSHTPAFVYLLLHMFLILFHAYRISWFMQTLQIHGSRRPKTSNTET